MSSAGQYVAEPTHVREVSLRGTADLAFWTERLMSEDLAPVEEEGKAQIKIVAADMKFLGIRFREVSFSMVVACDEPMPSRHAAFLLHAFNSVRLFAFCERALFSTPYSHGACHVSTASPISIRLSKHGEVIFRAEMRTDRPATGREPSRHGDEVWEGPVYLPTTRRGNGVQGRFFLGRMKGLTEAYPFLAGRDAVTIRPARGAEVLQALIDSNFVGKGWTVRRDATHGKSKTYRRPNKHPQ